MRRDLLLSTASAALDDAYDLVATDQDRNG